jgi:transposase
VGVFPPEQQAVVKRMACERPQEAGKPLARFSVYEIALRAWERDIDMSYSTVWRLLHRDALRPWFQKQWLFPRDPLLLQKATPILDLYHHRWQGQPLGPRDVVLCADELTNLRPLARHHATEAAAPGRPGRYEFSHDRDPDSKLCYLAVLEVFTGRVYGEVGERSGITAFDRVIQHYLQSAWAAEADRIFVIVDNGSAHHPNTSPRRLAALDSRVTVVHLPTHSSWLNQIEIYFSILKRKALTPMDLPNGKALTERIYGFQRHYNAQAEPFTWNYTAERLQHYIRRLTKAGCFSPASNGDAGARKDPLTIH